MRKRILAIALTIALPFWPTASYSAELYLISVPNPALIEPGACTVFSVNEDCSLEKRSVIKPKRRIRTVLFNQYTGDLAVIRYVSDGELLVGTSQRAEGEVVFKNLGTGIDQQLVQLAFKPVLGGFFLSGTDRQPRVLIERFQNTESLIVDSGGQAPTAVNDDEVPWASVFTAEFDPFQSSGFIRAYIDVDNGSIFCRERMHDSQWSRLGFDLEPGELWGLAESRGMKLPREKHENAFIYIQTGEIAVFLLGDEFLQSNTQSVYVIYSKISGETRIVTFPYARSTMRLLGDYLVVRELQSNAEETGENSSSEFTFCNSQGDVLGTWTAPSDIRILFVDTRELIYRDGAVIYSLPIREGHLNTEERKCIVEDERLRDSHYAYKVNTE